jgi:hypothetical protein
MVKVSRDRVRLSTRGRTLDVSTLNKHFLEERYKKIANLYIRRYITSQYLPRLNSEFVA